MTHSQARSRIWRSLFGVSCVLGPLALQACSGGSDPAVNPPEPVGQSGSAAVGFSGSTGVTPPASGGMTDVDDGGTGNTPEGGRQADPSGGSRASGGRTNQGTAGRPNQGTGGTVGAAGQGPVQGNAGATSSMPGDPSLPAISGMCPAFATGTASIGGLAGISLQVGAKQQGTGSLVFYWHGTGSSASEVNAMLPAAVRQEILQAGGIIVSFGGSTGTGGDCSGTSTFSKDDFKIADLIAACAVRDHGIDPRRIYTTGCSAGGLQAGCMGALRSSYVAAVVPNSGGSVGTQKIEDAKQTPAVMTMHGGASDKVIVSFDQTSAAYDKQMKAAGSYVVNCNHGGGHCGAPAALYTAGWQFMKDHPFGIEPEPYTSALPASFPNYCAAY